MEILPAIFPVALVIAAGFVITRAGMMDAAGWTGVETLAYRLFFPVTLMRTIARSDIAWDSLGPYLAALIGALTLLGLAILSLRRVIAPARMSDAALSSLFQSVTRWNAFISLAAAELIAGAEGAALIAIALAVLVPLINIANIAVLARLGTADARPGAVLLQIARNPLVQGSLAGLALNLVHLQPTGALDDALRLISGGTLAVALLACGAGVEPRRLIRMNALVPLGLVLRLAVLPLTFLALAWGLGLPPAERLAGVLVLAVPTAANGYIVAKAMGGDAPLYADILSWQVLLSMIALPLLAHLALMI